MWVQSQALKDVKQDGDLIPFKKKLYSALYHSFLWFAQGERGQKSEWLKKKKVYSCQHSRLLRSLPPKLNFKPRSLRFGEINFS